MSAATTASFVLFPLGTRRFAVPAEQVTELARTDTMQVFPHTTPWVAGVLVRRGQIVPVCDIAQALVGLNVPPRRLYLLAKRRFEGSEETTAIPVTGDCELVTADLLPCAGKVSHNVVGLLAFENEVVEVLDLEKVLAEEVQ